MKKILITATALLLLNCGKAQNLNSPQASPTVNIKQNFALGTIELSYSRPGMKERKIMGGLVPFDKVWRTGANAATTISFSDDVSIGGKDVKAGKYGLLTIPGEKKWTIIISKDATVNQPSNYKEENDVVRVEANVFTMPFPIENFTIGINDLTNSSCNVGMMWENTYVQFPVTTNTDKKMMAEIDKVMNKDNKPYYAAASYYFENGKDDKQALAWINKALETNKEAFWMHMLKARIHNKLGDKVASKSAAMACKDLAAKAKNDDFVKMADEFLAGM